MVTQKVTKKTKVVPITLGELQNAEKEILRHVQEESFEEELTILTKASSTPPSGEQSSKRPVKKIEQDSQSRSPDDWTACCVWDEG